MCPFVSLYRDHNHFSPFGLLQTLYLFGGVFKVIPFVQLLLKDTDLSRRTLLIPVLAP